MADLAEYRQSLHFDAAEKAALRFTEAMCETSVNVPDEVFEELRRHCSNEQIVELTAAVAIENMRARFNRALEIPSDGLCQLPADHPVRRLAAAGR